MVKMRAAPVRAAPGLSILAPWRNCIDLPYFGEYSKMLIAHLGRNRGYEKGHEEPWHAEPLLPGARRRIKGIQALSASSASS